MRAAMSGTIDSAALTVRVQDGDASHLHHEDCSSTEARVTTKLANLIYKYVAVATGVRAAVVATHC
jgi:hypothetical protein